MGMPCISLLMGMQGRICPRLILGFSWLRMEMMGARHGEPIIPLIDDAD